MGNYSATQFEMIGNIFPDDAFLLPRGVSAFFSTLIVPLVYLISREMGRSVAASLLVATFCIVDGVILVSSRFILTDAMLWFFGLLTVYCGLRFWHTEGEGEQRHTARWWGWCIMTGTTFLSPSTFPLSLLPFSPSFTLLLLSGSISPFSPPPLLSLSLSLL